MPTSKNQNTMMPWKLPLELILLIFSLCDDLCDDLSTIKSIRLSSPLGEASIDKRKIFGSLRLSGGSHAAAERVHQFSSLSLLRHVEKLVLCTSAYYIPTNVAYSEVTYVDVPYGGHEVPMTEAEALPGPAPTSDSAGTELCDFDLGFRGTPGIADLNLNIKFTAFVIYVLRLIEGSKPPAGLPVGLNITLIVDDEDEQIISKAPFSAYGPDFWTVLGFIATFGISVHGAIRHTLLNSKLVLHEVRYMLQCVSHQPTGVGLGDFYIEDINASAGAGLGYRYHMTIVQEERVGKDAVFGMRREALARR